MATTFFTSAFYSFFFHDLFTFFDVFHSFQFFVVVVVVLVISFEIQYTLGLNLYNLIILF